MCAAVHSDWITAATGTAYACTDSTANTYVVHWGDPVVADIRPQQVAAKSEIEMLDERIEAVRAKLL